MKMSEVKVGMRFVKMNEPGKRIIRVTKLTERGFQYDYEDGKTIPLIPRWEQYMLPNDHEHYGLDGETWNMKRIYRFPRLHSAFIAFITLLTGCATIPVAAPPQIVTVTHTVYQPIPTAYLTPCLIPIGTPTTNNELLIHDQAAMSDLMACNQQLERIKTLAPSAATHQ